MRVMLLAATCVLAPLAAQDKVDYQADVRFAIEEIREKCKLLIASKKIDWKKATDPLLAESKKTKTDAQHLLLMWRLLARLQDGHAAVKALGRAKDVELDVPERSAGPGMFLCDSGGKVYVKNVWGPAQVAGLEPGMEVLTIAGAPALQWLGKRTSELADVISFSTPQQAAFYTRHWGLADVPGTRLEVEVKDGAAKKKRTIEYGKASQIAHGPAYPPADLKVMGDLFAGRTAGGFGYVHVRRCKDDLPSRMDEALATVGDSRGLILDFRGNGGGGFDHDALFGRFVPAGKTWGQYRSAGAQQYTGPIVVIVDATVRSAGETGSGMFAEDGRAYSIGESATAGMSSQKVDIELPSKLCSLHVSVASNKGRFQGGKGLEGIGFIPHEIVPFDPKDLAAKRDTLIVRAEALLAAFAKEGFPKNAVRYDPKDHGWVAPRQN
jgi:C-terminal processing protease CtpA/Prc